MKKIFIILLMLILFVVHIESKKIYPDYIVKFYRRRGISQDKIFHEARMTYTTNGFYKYRNVRLWPEWKPSSDEPICETSFGTYWWMYLIMFVLGFFLGVVVPILLKYFSVYQLLL